MITRSYYGVERGMPAIAITLRLRAGLSTRSSNELKWLSHKGHWHLLRLAELFTVSRTYLLSRY